MTYMIFWVPAAMLDIDFYASKVGMVDGTAHLFHEWVKKELVRIDQARVRRKEKGKKKAQVVVDDEDRENMPPSTLTST